MDEHDEQADTPGRPVLRVIDADASAEEIAAVLAVLGTTREEQRARACPEHPAWGNRSMLARRAAREADGWRRSSQPG